MKTITNNYLKLIKNLLLISFSILIFSNGEANVLHGNIQNIAKDTVSLRFAITKAEHTHGLSGLKSTEFKDTEGMLFVNRELGPRKFWMPDTYFNLDIIFLDQNLKIVGIEKNVAAHPGMKEPPEIVKTGVYSAQFILETKAMCKFSKNLKIGDQLTYLGKPSLSEIVSSIHPEQ